jgi:hypothetical protein
VVPGVSRGAAALPKREKSNSAEVQRNRANINVKSSQVNTLPNAKSQAKDKRAKDRFYL